jgi:hypothetical protein
MFRPSQDDLQLPCQVVDTVRVSRINQFIADIFGVSCVSECGLMRHFGWRSYCICTPRRKAILWHISLDSCQDSTLTVCSNYHVTMIGSWRYRSETVTEFIIHPVPVDELVECIQSDRRYDAPEWWLCGESGPIVMIGSSITKHEQFNEHYTATMAEWLPMRMQCGGCKAGL